MASPVNAPTTTRTGTGASLRGMVNNLSIPYGRVVVSELPSEVLLNVRLLIEHAKILERDLAALIESQSETPDEDAGMPDAVPSRGDDVHPAPAGAVAVHPLSMVEPEEEKAVQEDVGGFVPAPVYRSTLVMTKVGGGPGYFGEHFYRAAGTGIVYDTRDPPPHPCRTCGIRHWSNCGCPIGNQTVQRLIR